MAEQSKDKSGDSSMEKMYEIFSKLLEQQQRNTVPETVKYALEPNPVRLAGPQVTMLVGHAMLNLY